MENVYRKAIQQLKKGSGISPLFPVDWCFTEYVDISNNSPLEDNSNKTVNEISNSKPLDDPSKKAALHSDAESIQASSNVTEKAKILDSLHKFGEEKIDSTTEKVFRFPGGEMSFKDHAGEEDSKAFNIKDISLEALKEQSKRDLGNELFQLRESLKSVDSISNIKILFVTDSFLEIDTQKSEAGLYELPLFFDQSVSTLFQRMITAMKVEPSEYYVSAVSKNGETSDLMSLLMQEVSRLRPKLIITLGAQATNEILQINKRLKDIHGQFFQIALKDEKSQESRFELMPLFSPKLLNTAPSMKKTAWIDMQKAMELLS